MLFNSFSFILFLIAVFVMYYLPWLKNRQVQVLLVASTFFYAWANPWYLLLLFASAAINTVVSFRIYHAKRSAVARFWAVNGVVINLLLLSFFKYGRLLSGFFTPGTAPAQFLSGIPLAIGISFYTFEGISLLVDVFKNKVASAKNIVVVHESWLQHAQNVLLFITFFPHLIAGPILKAKDFIPQIAAKHFQNIEWDNCFKKLILGYFLKMVIADNLKDQTFWIAYPYFEGHHSFTLFMLLLGYSAQIFADFAGYSLIALGLGSLFGYQLETNFNYPYISQTFSEFWRRWHISLSGFLKEYLYIPLGGNRKSALRTYINLLITMILGGLWHGAAWSYAVWGFFHGAALAIERFLQGRFTLPNNTVVRVLRRLTVFSFVTLAWLLFKLPEFTEVIAYLKAFVHNTDKYIDHTIVTYLLLYSLPVAMIHFIYLHQQRTWAQYLFFKVEYFWYGLLLFAILVNSGSSGSFIYFQF